MGRAFSTYGGAEKRIPVSVGKVKEVEHMDWIRGRWEDNIKTEFKECEGIIRVRLCTIVH